MVVVGKTNSVLFADFTFLVELFGKLFKCVDVFLWSFPWTNKILHPNGGSISSFLLKILCDIAMAGHDLHSQLIHITLKFCICHSPKHSFATFKTFYLLIAIRSQLF